MYNVRQKKSYFSISIHVFNMNTQAALKLKYALETHTYKNRFNFRQMQRPPEIELIQYRRLRNRLRHVIDSSSPEAVTCNVITELPRFVYSNFLSN